LGLYDRSFGGSYSNVNLGLSGAYHKILGEEGRSKLGLGFQASLATKKISIDGLSFANQFTNGGFNSSLPNNESFLTRSSSYIDFNTGLLYQYDDEYTSFYLGASMYHIDNPNVSLRTDAVYKLPSRYTAHAGARLTVGDNSNELFLSGSLMYQAEATDKLLGGAYGVNLSNDSRNLIFYMGSWYRFGDSFIPYVGLDYKKIQLGVSYDIINSDLKLASPKTGSFEISFNYLGFIATNPYTNYKSNRFF
jgi:type IX secretion system PorP/SprF family membrane protein